MDFYEMIGKHIDEAVRLLPDGYFLISGVAADGGIGCMTYGSFKSNREISFEIAPGGIVYSIGLQFAPEF